ncbi:hypothetical protein TNCV_2200321 [Trichonephila clavipes]|nr:hypothetical protein TNCV_2200321 [Trichonephila clavipes]
MLKHLRFDISELQETKLPERLINTTNERRLVQGHNSTETQDNSTETNFPKFGNSCPLGEDDLIDLMTVYDNKEVDNDEVEDLVSSELVDVASVDSRVPTSGLDHGTDPVTELCSMPL